MTAPLNSSAKNAGIKLQQQNRQSMLQRTDLKNASLRHKGLVYKAKGFEHMIKSTSKKLGHSISDVSQLRTGELTNILQKLANESDGGIIVNINGKRLKIMPEGTKSHGTTYNRTAERTRGGNIPKSGSTTENVRSKTEYKHLASQLRWHNGPHSMSLTRGRAEEIMNDLYSTLDMKPFLDDFFHGRDYVGFTELTEASGIDIDRNRYTDNSSSYSSSSRTTGAARNNYNTGNNNYRSTSTPPKSDGASYGDKVMANFLKFFGGKGPSYNLRTGEKNSGTSPFFK